MKQTNTGNYKSESWISFVNQDGREGRLFYCSKTNQYRLIVDHNDLREAKQTEKCLPYVNVDSFNTEWT